MYIKTPYILYLITLKATQQLQDDDNNLKNMRSATF